MLTWNTYKQKSFHTKKFQTFSMGIDRNTLSTFQFDQVMDGN